MRICKIQTKTDRRFSIGNLLKRRCIVRSYILDQNFRSTIVSLLVRIVMTSGLLSLNQNSSAEMGLNFPYK